MSHNKQYMTVDRQRHRAVAVLEKIKTQFPAEDKLFFRIFERSVLDLFDFSWRSSAVSYLNSSTFCMDICGVDRDWVMYMLKKAGVCFDMRCRESGAVHAKKDCEFAWCSRPLVIERGLAFTKKINARPDTVKQAIESTERMTYADFGDSKPGDMREYVYNDHKQSALEKLRSLA